MPYRQSQNTVGDVLTFRTMITPSIIQIFFWGGLLLLFISAGLNFFWGAKTIVSNAASSAEKKKRVAELDQEIAKKSKEQPNWLIATQIERLTEEKQRISTSENSSNLAAVMWMLGSLFGMVFGMLTWRVICELMIVTFKIHEELKSQTEAMSARNQYGWH